MLLTKLIRSKMEKLGIKSEAELARRSGVIQSSVHRLLKDGEHKAAKNINNILISLDIISEKNLDDIYLDGEMEPKYTKEYVENLKEQLNNYKDLMRIYKKKAEQFRSCLHKERIIKSEKNLE